MGMALGIDLGGTKIEAQLFDDSWQVARRHRIATPKTYDALVAAMADQIAWGEAQAGDVIPTGISAAGLISHQTGLALTANLSATGKPFPDDINAAAGRPIAYVNDCRALTLSEAKFGAGRGQDAVVGLILGTGIGGGFAQNGALWEGPAGVGGEFGHMPLPAAVMHKHGLQVLSCGCGRMGCIETYLAGPGLERLAQHVGVGAVSTQEIAARRHEGGKEAQAWAIWLELLASLIHTINQTCGPDVVVLAGGLSAIDGLVDEITAQAKAQAWEGFPAPQIMLAEGGDASGARGAAYAALLDCEKDRSHG